MAFKNTSEGRVFFQGSNGSSTAQDTARRVQQPGGAGASPASAQSGQPTQVQILSLLRSLNDKLKATQAERGVLRSEMEGYRRAMEELQTRAQRGERAEKLAQETMKELEETRKLLLDLEERQAGIEKEHKSNAEKIRTGVGSYRELVKRVEVTEQKQDDFGRKQDETDRKVEEAASQQARIMRQVEKAIEDRTRFMRKIERIEETVIQTRDALNAKAMVLLTDQNISGSVPTDIESVMREVAEQIEPGVPTHVADQPAQSPGHSTTLQAAAILLLVIGGILAGWAVSEMQRPQPQETGEFQINEYAAPENSEAVEQAAQDAQANVDVIVDKWNVSDDTSAFAETQTAEAVTPSEVATEAQDATSSSMPPVAQSSSDDIGTLDLNDQKKLQEMLDSDPDALAAELNKIEPSSEPTPNETTEMKIASLPVEETKTIEPDMPVTAPVEAQVETPAPAPKQTADELRKLMRPDSSLPDTVKKIEEQAFNGVPEAQHDLAAIYTAGHGGVEQNYKRALFWFEQSADAGIANAAYNLGVLNHQGLGTKPDLDKAIVWYKKAAALGHPEAQYNLGIAYIEGVGVQYDPKKAHDYFEKAASKGIIEAAYNLGLIYENGLLGKPQPDEALVWYKEAADKGSPEAKAALEQLAKTLNLRAEDIDSVVDSARKSNPDAPQIRSDAATGNNEAMVAKIQQELMTLGLYPGPADGSTGPLTEDAIRAYQSKNKMEVTGLASNDLLEHMMRGNKDF